MWNKLKLQKVVETIF